METEVIANITLQRTGTDLAYPTTVHLQALTLPGDTALPGKDFQQLSSECGEDVVCVEFPAWERKASFGVVILPDRALEGNENISIDIIEVVGGVVATPTQSQLTITIVDGTERKLVPSH